MDNNNQNGYIPAFYCNQIVPKQILHIYIFTNNYPGPFTLISLTGSINKNLVYPSFLGQAKTCPAGGVRSVCGFTGKLSAGLCEK